MKKLGIFLSLFFLSVESNANPLIAAYESSMSAYLIGAGLTKEDANRESAKMSAYAFGGSGNSSEVSSSKGCVRAGRSSCQKITVGETVLNYNTEGKLDFISTTNQTVSELQSMSRLRQYNENDILKFLYKDGELGDLTFKETYKRDDFIEKLMSFTNVDDGDFAVAPAWFDSAGSYLYRTSLPINSENHYLYFNTYTNLYNGYWKHLQDIEPYSEEKEAYLDLTDDYRALIYRSYYKPVEVSSNDHRTQSDYFSKKTFPNDEFLLIKKSIFELSKDDISSHIFQAKQIAEDEKISLDEAYETSFGGLDKIFFTRTEDIQVPVSIVKPRSDLNTEDDLKEEEQKENIEIVHRIGTIEERAKRDYVVSPKAITNSFENMKNDYFAANGNVVRTSSGQTVNVDTSRKLQSLDLSSVSAKDRVSYQLGSFVDRTSSISSYDEYRKANPIAKGTDTVEDVEDRNKPAPPTTSGALDNTGNLNPATGSGADTNISSDGKVSAGSNSSVGSNTGAVSNSQASSISKPAESAETKEEEKSDYKEPDLPLITGIEILQPLLNLKDSLLSTLNFNVPAGSCPIFNIDFFGSNLTLDVHCTIIEKIAAAISALFLIIYNIFAIRIVLSS